MKRVIYMVLTLAFALSLGGCSSSITTKDLTMLEEAESQETEHTSSALTTDVNYKILPTVMLETTKI